MRKHLLSQHRIKNEGNRRIRFVISDGSVDRDGDTINVNGWELDNYRKNPVVLWAHDRSALPVARCVEIGVRNGRLEAVAEFAHHEFAESVYQMYLGGFMRATSVGFRPIAKQQNYERGGYDFLRQELFEFSCVPVPANANALVAAGNAGINTALIKSWAKQVLGRGPEAKLAALITASIQQGAQRALDRKCESLDEVVVDLDEPILEIEEFLDVNRADLTAAMRVATKTVVREAVQEEAAAALRYATGRLD